MICSKGELLVGQKKLKSLLGILHYETRNRKPLRRKTKIQKFNNKIHL